MNGSNLRLAASMIEDRHREAAQARRSSTVADEGGARRSSFALLAAVRALATRHHPGALLRRSNLRTEH